MDQISRKSQFAGEARVDPHLDCLSIRVGRKSQWASLAKRMASLKLLPRNTLWTPVLVEDRVYTDAWLIASEPSRNDGNHAALKKSFDELIAAGTKQLYYISGTNLLGDDNDGAVDSSHPNDLGFARQVDAFDKVLEPLMK